MKKIVCFLMMVVLSFASLTTLAGCTKREDLLKLYMPGEYIDEDIFEDFAEYYKEQTGKKVKVQISLFNTLEEMLTRMDMEKPDFDLICPSDYAIERMISRGWVQKIDKNVIKAEDVTRSEYLALSRQFDADLEYSVPYMYGTMGIMYNYQKTNKQLDSWASIFEGEFHGDVYQKKSMREFYTSACLYAKRDELSEASDGFNSYGTAYRTLIDSIFADTSATMLAQAKSVLETQKTHLRKYDDEDGKFLMAQNEGTAALAWSCDAGYVMSEYEDDDGNIQQGNPNLWYIIPKEGGNVYIDSFVISAYAKNVEAANWFIKFVCQKDIAIQNSEYIGAISPVEAAYDQLLADYAERAENKTDMFEGKSEEWCEMYIDMLFPSQETLARCAVNPDYKNALEEQAIASMFADMTN